MLHYGLLWNIEVGGRKYGFDKVHDPDIADGGHAWAS